ncbi:hypothetical protein AVEN_162420-1 [Araneus ventricosus]|uniref:Uncharacterized protein n=1 Tax=Araneus ventricosus TaxID=182803 RepID=A0A4Y2T0E2_ARAVE|nr:hypothetical protein AVEN_162420-1 [Araneus ventricosus]
MAPKLLKRICRAFASIFKSARTKQPSVMPEPGELGDDMQEPTQVNWEHIAARWYLEMRHYFMERDQFDRENKIHTAFGESPIPSFEYPV